MKSSTRISLNTIILFIKLIITISVNLIATRLILNAMGVEDYGIVNLISGIVSMFTFLQNSMAVSTQRFMSVNMGKDDIGSQQRIFNTSVILHLLLGLFIILIIECCYPFVFQSSIQIPENRIFSAQVLYHLMAIGTFVTVMSVPYDATLNAHENMLWFSLASVLESFIRVGGAILITYYHGDKLIYYGVLLIAIRLVSYVFKVVYCTKHYEDARIERTKPDKTRMKEMLSFSFWNLFGALAMTARTQGVAVILNTFLGVIVNAAYGIALQVFGQCSTFTSTIQKAMNPQIMKREGADNRKGMISLALKQSKYSFFLFSFIAIPLFVEMPHVLKIWLKEVPENTIEFCRLFLILAMLQKLSTGLQVAVQALGKIKLYQVSVSVLLLLNLPVAYILLKCEMPPALILVSMCIIEILLIVLRFEFSNKLVGIQLKEYFCNVIRPCSLLIILDISLMYIVCSILNMPQSFIRLTSITALSLVVSITSMYIILSKDEKLLIRGMLLKFRQMNHRKSSIK